MAEETEFLDLTQINWYLVFGDGSLWRIKREPVETEKELIFHVVPTEATQKAFGIDYTTDPEYDRLLNYYTKRVDKCKVVSLGNKARLKIFFATCDYQCKTDVNPWDAARDVLEKTIQRLRQERDNEWEANKSILRKLGRLNRHEGLAEKQQIRRYKEIRDNLGEVHHKEEK